MAGTSDWEGFGRCLTKRTVWLPIGELRWQRFLTGELVAGARFALSLRCRGRCGCVNRLNLTPKFTTRAPTPRYTKPMITLSGSCVSFTQTDTLVFWPGVGDSSNVWPNTDRTTTLRLGVFSSASKSARRPGSTSGVAPKINSVSPSISDRQPTAMHDPVDEKSDPLIEVGISPLVRSATRTTEFGGDSFADVVI